MSFSIYLKSTPLFLCFITLPVSAQVFQGKILDKEGHAIPYASIYLQEQHRGITTDHNGSFEVELPAGSYRCDVGAFGYATHSWSFTQNTENTSYLFQLDKRKFSLEDTKIKDSENPATNIIMKTIGAASFYQKQLSSYQLQVYKKTKGNLIRIPFLQKVSKSIRHLAKNYLNKPAYSEEFMRVDFQSPNLYKVRTEATTNVFPEQMCSNVNPVTVNLYSPMIFGKLSPISKEAFRYYRYVLICSIKDAGRKIYKIQIIPRHNAPQLLSGYIYVVDNLWSIAAYDLLFFNSHIVSHVNVRCAEIEPSLFMPISITSKTDIHNNNIESLESAIYSLHYLHFTYNKDLEDSGEDEILDQTDTLRSIHRYELLSPREVIKKVADSSAFSRDSLYWKRVRTLPLLPFEANCYKASTPMKTEKKDWGDIRSWWILIVKGNKFQSNDEKRWFTSYDIATFVPEYNFVDGFWLGCKFDIGTKLSNTKSIVFNPSIYYTTARHRWVGKANLAFNYTPRRQGKLSIEGGMLTEDYNSETGESRFFCAVSALIYADNYIKLYNRRYLSLTNQIEPYNGLLFKSSLNWEWREMIENNIHHSILGQNAEINHPLENPDFTMPTHRLFKATFSLEYTPSVYYRMEEHQKVYEYTSNPTFRLQYEQAFSLSDNILYPKFKKLSAGISENVKVGLFNHFVWALEGGTFFDSKDMQFPDYHHFPTVMNTSTRRSFTQGFSLLDCYTYSSSKNWAMMNMTWNTPYFLVKYLPLFRKKSFDESIHARMLASHTHHPYFEIGYSVGVEDISRVGIFYGFNYSGYRSVGISISFPLF